MFKEYNYRDFLCTHKCAATIERVPCQPCRPCQPCTPQPYCSCCSCCYPPCPPYPPYPPYPPHPLHPPKFLTCYMEALGCSQSLSNGGLVVFSEDSVDNVGNFIDLDDTGTIFTITRTGIYQITWNLNLSTTPPLQAPAVFGILENGENASGAASSQTGSFSSGTMIYVEKTPFTISLINYANAAELEDHPQFENSAASIRIVRVADGPSGLD